MTLFEHRQSDMEPTGRTVVIAEPVTESSVQSAARQVGAALSSWTEEDGPVLVGEKPTAAST